MFSHMAQHRAIVVTGPQRSGTRIAAQMIAHDLHMSYVDEQVFAVYNYTLWQLIVTLGIRVVVQCPSMSRYAHVFRQEDNVGVVMMIRPIDEILTSQERIQWPESARLSELQSYGLITGEPAVVKYNYWNEEQKALTAFPYEIHYHDLEAHPLWVAQEERKVFDWWQTKA